MKFEPLLFIEMAQRNGITLSRIKNDIVAKNAHGPWIPVIKKHKRKLLKHLPDHQIKSLQRDLFEDEID